jgi:hypothetical protein
VDLEKETPMQSIFLRTSKAFAILAAAMIAASATRSTAEAGTVQFHAEIEDVQLACYNAGGKDTTGTGRGGYGCKTGNGEVSCNKGGNCTGTCSKCGTRTVGLGQILTKVVNHHVGRSADAPTMRHVVPGGGILEGDSGFGTQGPAATGVPLNTGRGSPSSGRIN